ncbi:hypothetical protein PHISP_00673 [Aspergillus sp. HF37]|nr:hypothetical protein PHISP_00673 [Aspergillus sp. HF37]
MFDLALRQTKEQGLQSICPIIPAFVQPTHITLVAFLFGLLSCISAAFSHYTLALPAWLLNRVLDGLDGSVARNRNNPTEVGGFVDLLCDFVIYSLLPISVGYGEDRCRAAVDWHAIACLEASFHLNNSVLLYVAAVEGKRRGHETHDELTSLAMRPALVEGLESGVLFTLMLAYPGYFETVAWGMAGAVSVGILQRVWYVVPVLGRLESR